MIKVVLFDDEQVILDGLHMRLSVHTDIQIVGEATTAAEVLQLVELHQPDVLVMDVCLVDADFATTLRTALAKAPFGIFVFSAEGRTSVIRQALRMGACGYMLRCEDTATLVAEAVHSVAKGIPWLSPEVKQRLLQEESDNLSLTDAGLTFAAANLSDAEVQVLQRLTRDMTNAEIAKSMHITENTVCYHLKSIYGKLGVKSRVGAAVWAVKNLPPFEGR